MDGRVTKRGVGGFEGLVSLIREGVDGRSLRGGGSPPSRKSKIVYKYIYIYIWDMGYVLVCTYIYGTKYVGMM